MKLIALSNGCVSKVSDRDFYRVSKYKWCCVKTGRHLKKHIYAARTVRENGKKTTLYLHVFIKGKKGIDHKDGDGLNNVRSNLRRANRSQNGHNRKIQKHSSKFKGVSFWSRVGKWEASLKFKTRIHLGYFDSEIEAAKAYDRAAIHFFGKFALTNSKQLGGQLEMGQSEQC